MSFCCGFKIKFEAAKGGEVGTALAADDVRKGFVGVVVVVIKEMTEMN